MHVLSEIINDIEYFSKHSWLELSCSSFFVDMVSFVSFLRIATKTVVLYFRLRTHTHARMHARTHAQTGILGGDLLHLFLSTVLSLTIRTEIGKHKWTWTKGTI